MARELFLVTELKTLVLGKKNIVFMVKVVDM